MRYMVNANKAGLILLFCAYGSFVVFDHLKLNDKEILVEYHVHNLKSRQKVDALILGGSNAMLGLSAELLSSTLGGNWYNATLTNEGGNEGAYSDFIEGLDIERRSILKIVYSSVSPHRKYLIQKRNNNKLIEKIISIKPHRNALSYIRELFGLRKKSPLPNAWGDFSFEQYECNLKIEKIDLEREEIDTVVDWLVVRYRYLSSLFFKAKIYIVFPSEYYTHPGIQVDEFERQVEKRFLEAVDHNFSSQSFRVQLIFQPPFPSEAYVCDDYLHANGEGRKWRTSDLIDRILRE